MAQAFNKYEQTGLDQTRDQQGVLRCETSNVQCASPGQPLQ